MWELCSTKNKKTMVIPKSKVLSTIKIKFVVIRTGLLYIKMLTVILRATTNKISQKYMEKEMTRELKHYVEKHLFPTWKRAEIEKPKRYKMYGEDCQSKSVEKEQSLQRGTRGQLDSHTQKNTTVPLPHITYKKLTKNVSLKVSLKNLDVSAKTIKHVEENTPANLHDCGLSSGFSAMTPKAQQLKKIRDVLNSSKCRPSVV